MTTVVGSEHRAEERELLAAFVHGLEDTSQAWSTMVNAAGKWASLVPDLPWGTGNDYGWRREGTPGALLHRCLARYGDSIDLLVAHSFGTGAALELLARQQARVGAVVLIAPIYRAGRGAPTWSEFDTCRRSFVSQMAEGVKARLGDRSSQVANDVLSAMVDKAVDRIGPRSFLAAFDEYLLTSELDLSRVEVPVLVIAAPGDPSLTDRQADALASRLPVATIVRDEGYDHFCHMRAAESVLERLRAFAATAIGRTREVSP